MKHLLAGLQGADTVAEHAVVGGRTPVRAEFAVRSPGTCHVGDVMELCRRHFGRRGCLRADTCPSVSQTAHSNHR